MIRRLYATLAVVPALAIWLAAQPQFSDAVRGYIKVDSPVVALTNVRVIDGTGAPARPNQTVVIKGGNIETVGDSVWADEGATSVGSVQGLVRKLIEKRVTLTSTLTVFETFTPGRPVREVPGSRREGWDDCRRQAADVRNVETVFKQGIGFDPAKLIESVRGKAGLW